MKTKFIALAAIAFCSSAFAQQSGYVTQPAGGHVMNPYGLCWHSGFWTDDQAVSPCDKAANVQAPAPQAVAPVKEVVAEPKPEPVVAPVAVQETPAPVPVAAPVQPSYEKVTLSADVLFDFGKSSLKDAGKQKLDELADRLQGAQLDEIRIVGHADRIGSAQGNKRLSEERAKTVKAYLESRANARSIQTAGRGSAQLVTGSTCRGMGAEQGSNRRLVQC